MVTIYPSEVKLAFGDFGKIKYNHETPKERKHEIKNDILNFIIQFAFFPFRAFILSGFRVSSSLWLVFTSLG